jgi:hypothetical protein
MLTSLLLLAATERPAALSTKHDPPVHLWYNSSGDYAYGDRAKVYARAADNGYLVVLREDMDGRVRVLSPVDPSGDQHVDGGKKYELKGRGGREAFVAEDSTGQGLVLAAWSRTPFTFDQYVKDGHWNLDKLSGAGSQSGDPESRLMSIVDDMQKPGEHFDYDLAVYTVAAPHYAHAYYPYPYGWAGWWGYNPWWGFGPPLTTTRVFFTPARRIGEGRRFEPEMREPLAGAGRRFQPVMRNPMNIGAHRQ